MTEKQAVTKNSSQNDLNRSQSEMQDWYDNQFMPYKKQKEQEKEDFKEFTKIVISNTNEIKYMLANIYDSKFETAIKTWNELKLEPKAKQMLMQDNELIIIDENDNELSVNFDKLLSDISHVLGE